MRPDFEEFGKIPRLNRDIIVTEKIDGTNAGIYIDDEDQVHACSRKRWITPEDDNFGFARWVKAHENELRDLGYGMHWGEWWGAGIQRRYGLDEKRFSLFNTGRWINKDLSNCDIGVAMPPECCHVVPILWVGNFQNFDCRELLILLANKGSAAALGFSKPEGIVIYHTALRSYFKATIEKDEQHKSEQNAPPFQEAIKNV